MSHWSLSWSLCQYYCCLPRARAIIISHHLPPPLCLTQSPLTMIMFIVCRQEGKTKPSAKTFSNIKCSAELSKKFRQTSINIMITPKEAGKIAKYPFMPNIAFKVCFLIWHLMYCQGWRWSVQSLATARSEMSATITRETFNQHQEHDWPPHSWSNIASHLLWSVW